MARIPLGALTTLNLATHLDPQFVDLYGLRELISTPGYVATTPRITIDGSGNASFAANLSVAGTFSLTGVFNGPLNVSRSASTTAFRAGVLIGNASNTIGQISEALAFSVSNVNAAIWSTRYPALGGDLVLASQPTTGGDPVARVSVGANGTFAPVTDNTYQLGASSLRWTTVYAATGSINTSDAREKTSVRPLNSAELAAAKQLSREIGAYRFLSSVREKGDAAREHIGMTVQRAIEIMDSFGIDPMAYGFICYDSWPEEVKPAQYREDQRDTGMLDTAGNPIMETERVEIAPEEVIPAGDRYSFRPDELLMFIARGLEARLAALEAA